MKFKAEVVSVEANSMTLRIRALAHGVRDAEWRESQLISFEVTNTKAQRRAFLVGREVSIEVKPR